VKARALAELRAHKDIVRLWAVALVALALGLLILAAPHDRWVRSAVGSVFLSLSTQCLMTFVRKRRKP
jgi:hypothetical protein